MTVNLSDTITHLRSELRRVQTAIETLESLAGVPSGQSKSKRGRKNMSPEERLIVGERMRKYWASRREQNHQDNTPGTP